MVEKGKRERDGKEQMNEKQKDKEKERISSFIIVRAA